MSKRVVIIGGSVGGLGAALGLVRRGFLVTVIERDLGPDTEDGDHAFLNWTRRGVPQFRQPHAFSARTRNLLLEHAPEVVDRLHDDGIEESNIFKLLAPPEMWSDEDDSFAGFMVRRPGFELALRRAVEATPGIEVRCPAAVDGLVFADPVDGVPRVSGVRLDDGTEVLGDAVLDCGGRRSPVVKWLADVGTTVPADTQDCDTVYFTRYYRQLPESTLPIIGIFGLRGELEGGVAYIGFPGDHGSFGILISAMPDDEDMRAARHEWAWEALANATPAVQSWIDPGNAVPLTGVQFMGGHQNVRRRYVVEGEPLVLGLLPIGDALCATNPQYGWGASMALTYAFAAADVIDRHVDDPRAIALAYDRAIAAEADGVYRESAAMDRLRVYTTRGLEIPEHDRAEMERQDLIARGLMPGALRDPVLGRALLRRTNLLDRPDAVFDDPEVVEKAREVRDFRANRPVRKLGPDREERRSLFAAMNPAAEPALI